jgi:hypothetical protein
MFERILGYRFGGAGFGSCCGRWHRTPEAADRCREQATAAIRRGHGPSAYYFGHALVLVEDEGGRYVRRARDEEWG